MAESISWLLFLNCKNTGFKAVIGKQSKEYPLLDVLGLMVLLRGYAVAASAAVGLGWRVLCQVRAVCLFSVAVDLPSHTGVLGDELLEG